MYMAELKICSFNLGLLRVKVFGLTAKASPPYVAERFKQIPAALCRSGADIVFLQEIYEDAHVEALLAAARAAGYEHHARADTRSGRSRWRQFHNGLLVLSKLPIDAFECIKHAQSSSLERAFGCKSCLLTRITTPVGKLCFVNMHSMLIWGSNRD
jgi:endonuclease/exonuclease/phosphatase family metal-dependent hydrolase